MTMIKPHKTALLTALLFGAISSGFAAEAPDVQQLFKKQCALCHAIDKKKLGQAVNTMSHEVEILRQTIKKGVKGKNKMPGYEGKLTPVEIDALVNYILANQGGR